MSNNLKFYIGGQWVEPLGGDSLGVVNPATEETVATIAMGTPGDVDAAVAAAKAAFVSFSESTKAERIELLDAIIAAYKERMDDIAHAISLEMGAPARLAAKAQAPAGFGHLLYAKRALEKFEFTESVGTTEVIYEPVGVCGLITPWNWPVNQIGAKVGPAIAAGCTMVLKPSEIAPLSAIIFAEVMDAAKVPAGVFNLVNGDGPTVGEAMSAHPDIDMMSFTGSTRAGISVAIAAAPTVKRVAQELGGKSANIILDDADFGAVISRDVVAMCSNSGQSCNAGTRMLVPHSRMAEAAEIAKEAALKLRVGAPDGERIQVGPVVSETQYNKIQTLIQAGIDEGAVLEAGGTGRPDGLERGYYVKPTVFSNVKPSMTIASEEIFGPVLSIIGYEDEAEAITIANDTDYGLSGYVSSSDLDHARSVARQIRTGMVHINGAALANDAPFGGYKQSGNGREYGSYGIKEFLEAKSIFGFRPKD